MSDCVEAVRRALAGRRADARFLAGVSGGRDSVGLLHAVIEAGWRNVVVCHLDHGLRGRESTADARFVGRLAARLGVGFELGKVDVAAEARARGISIETCGREVRREFFAACARRLRAPRLLLAHHGDDQVETCLFHFLRGSGAAGLAGMRAVSRLGSIEVIRPWLGLAGADVAAFVSERGIRFREDSSNASLEHTRNRLRREVLPVIETTFGASFRGAILRAAEIFSEEDAWMASASARFVTGDDLDVRALRGEPMALQRRAIRAWLVGRGVAEVGFAEVAEVMRLVESDAVGKVNLPGAVHARRRAGRIFLEVPANPKGRKGK